MPYIKYMSPRVNVTTSQMRPPFVLMLPILTLRHLYVRIPLVNIIRVALLWFLPLNEPCINLLKHSYINDPEYADLDAACFIMFTKDFLTLFGFMVCSTIQKVLVKVF